MFLKIEFGHPIHNQIIKSKYHNIWHSLWENKQQNRVYKSFENKRCWELTHVKVGSWTRQFSRTAIHHFCVTDSLSEFNVGQPTLFDYGNNHIPLLPDYFGLFLSPLLTVDFILEPVFCHSNLISSSIPNKEFSLFSLSGRLRRQLITVYRHSHSLTM